MLGGSINHVSITVNDLPKPRAAVEALDSLEDREAGGLSRAAVLVVDELSLERRRASG